MDFYTQDIPSSYQVWISIPRIYQVHTRYGFLYLGYTKYIPGMDFQTQDIPSIYQVWISRPRIFQVHTRYGFLYLGYSKYIPGMDFQTQDILRIPSYTWYTKYDISLRKKTPQNPQYYYFYIKPRNTQYNPSILSKHTKNSLVSLLRIPGISLVSLGKIDSNFSN